MDDNGARQFGRLFDEVPELYDRIRPSYPDALFADLVDICGIDARSSVLEVGRGTGQATRSLAALGASIIAVEPGTGMAALAREHLAPFANVDVEISRFEDWDDPDVREPLLDAIAERIRTRMDDRASRRYLSVLRVGRRVDEAHGRARVEFVSG